MSDGMSIIKNMFFTKIIILGLPYFNLIEEQTINYPIFSTAVLNLPKATSINRSNFTSGRSRVDLYLIKEYYFFDILLHVAETNIRNERIGRKE